MNSAKSLLSFLFIAFVIGACKKNSDPPIERTLGLTNNNTKTWQLSQHSVDNVPLILESCDKKMLYTFNTNGKFYFGSLDTLNCKNPVYLPDTGNWAFNADKSQITITDSKTHNNQFNIDDLSANSLRLLFNSKVRLTFTAKTN